ncbi:hypothetical protein EV140_1477 [Microcella alkaliphila]|uniref:Uncharacterized protein n=2 Tax=Microcella alkaliphila TaxID=279828 RepID=A0A4Q7TJS8_9MICO|nr:hypothetical protein EV140_1477 [Microcella alkaliphila]
MGWVAPVVDTLSTIHHNRAMTSYVRPEIAPQEYRDVSGTVIPYGERWGLAGPPEDSYSCVTHPERFAPLHEVARALVAHLTLTFDIEIERGASLADELGRRQIPIIDAYTLRPRAVDAAPLDIALTGYPGVVLAAGVLWESSYPVCGCDACDETWERAADELESHVLAVADGRFRESVATQGRADGRATYGYRFAGSMSGTGGLTHVSDAKREAAIERLATLSAGWLSWPRR